MSDINEKELQEICSSNLDKSMELTKLFSELYKFTDIIAINKYTPDDENNVSLQMRLNFMTSMLLQCDENDEVFVKRNKYGPVHNLSLGKKDMFLKTISNNRVYSNEYGQILLYVGQPSKINILTKVNASYSLDFYLITPSGDVVKYDDLTMLLDIENNIIKDDVYGEIYVDTQMLYIINGIIGKAFNFINKNITDRTNTICDNIFKNIGIILEKRLGHKYWKCSIDNNKNYIVKFKSDVLEKVSGTLICTSDKEIIVAFYPVSTNNILHVEKIYEIG